MLLLLHAPVVVTVIDHEGLTMLRQVSLEVLHDVIT